MYSFLSAAAGLCCAYPGRRSAWCAHLNKVLLVVFVSLMLPAAAVAATIRWDGGALTSAWTNGANWSGNVVPTASDDVILDNTYVSGSYSVELNGANGVARSLQIGYDNNTNTISLTIAGAPAGDNLRLGGAAGYDLIIANGGVLANQSTVSGSGQRGIEFINATDSWQMSGTGSYIHQQNAGNFLNVSGANVDFASTSTFELRSGLSSNWCSATGGLTFIKTYGNLKFNPAAGLTLNLRLATDSLRVKGNLTLFNSGLTLQLSNVATTMVRAHVLGNMEVTDAKFYVSSSSNNSRLVVDGNVTSTGAAARVGAAAPSGNPQGRFVIGGNLAAYYAGVSNNEVLSFWKPGSAAVSSFNPVAGSTFKAIDVWKEVALAGNLTFANASNRLTIRDGGTLDFNGYNVTGSGKFELAAGGTLKITSADGITSGNTALGNVLTTGTRIYESDATYWYKGGSSQVTGSALPSQVRALVVEKEPATTVVSLTNAVTVNHALTLTSGRLALGNLNLTMAAASAISGGSSASYVQTSASPSATGKLIRQVPNTGIGVLFPVGTSTYTPATLAQTGAGTTDNFQIRVFTGAFQLGTSGEALTVNSVNRTWMVEETVAGGSNASITLQWNTADEQPSFIRSNTRIRHYTAGAYDLEMPYSSAVGIDPYTLTRAGITSFSPFMVGDGSNLLPVELVRFTASATVAGNRLRWTTAQELKNAYFEVQRSRSATFDRAEVLDKVAGHGTSAQVHDYTYLDATAPAGVLLYYRLRQVDLDGTAHVSGIVAVTRAAPTSELTFYPNPATNQLTLVLPVGATTVVVFDNLGREVVLVDAGPAVLRLLDLAALPAGTYRLSVSGPALAPVTRSFVKAAY